MASLQALSSAVLDESKNYFRLHNLCHLGTLASACVAIFSSGELLYALALLAFVFELLGWIFNLIGNSRKSLGQELLRANMLDSAYGNKSTIAHAYLKRQVSSKSLSNAENFDQNRYYDTDEVLGKDKLKDILQESCFWSQHLYEVSRNRAIRNSVIIAVLLICFIVSLLTYLHDDANHSYARLVLLFFMTVPLWSEMSNVICWSSALPKKVSEIDYRIEAVSDASEQQVLALYADYNVVTACNPLIPQEVYDAERERLNGLWHERMSARQVVED